MLSEWLRARTAWLVGRVARLVATSGVSPNALTVMGFAFTAGVAVVLAQGAFVVGGVLLIVSALFDTLDGGVARATGRVSPFGAFLDSTLDRWAEALLYGGLLWWFWQQNQGLEATLAYATIIGSLLVSYTRARAEGLGIECKVGWFTRFERIAILVLGLLLDQITFALVPLAVLSNFTALQRMWHVYHVLAGEHKPRSGSG
ncbi:MAG: CDP-alcohol phosphatidyltransferase family protein [Ardenticatenia bacterium]|nr:CDP-alcohol phosphatidyltransferase family protein [Ardenticatenia bacterium]